MRAVPTFGTLAALQHGQFRLLLAGLIASNLGIWMQQFAIGWLVVQLAIRAGEPNLAGLYLGLTGLASAVPSLTFGLFAGVYADRVDRRKLLLASRAASAIVAFVLAAVVLADKAGLPLLMLLLAASSAAFAFDPPGRQAILPHVVLPRDLFSAVGLTRACMQAAHAVGPLVAGMLVIPAGVGGVLLAKALLDVISTGAIWLMRAHPADAPPTPVGVLGSLQEGLGHVRRDAILRWCVILQIVFALFAQSYQQLLPALAVETLHVGAVELSWMMGSAGLGAVLGAIVVASSSPVRRRGVLMLAAMVSTGTVVMLLGLQRELVGALVILALIGVLHQLFMGTQSVILQLVVPDRLRGRVMGLQSVVFQSASPVGVLGLGTAGSIIGLSNALFLAGLVVFGIAGLSLRGVPVIREFGTAGHGGASRTALEGAARSAE